MTSVLIDLGVLLRPSILASSLIAYVPAFQKVQVFEVDYARLLFALAGIIDDDKYAITNPTQAIQEYRAILASEIRAASDLRNPFTSVLLLDRAAKQGWIEFLPFGYWYDGYHSFFPLEVRTGLQSGMPPPGFSYELHGREFIEFLRSLKRTVESEVQAFDEGVGHGDLRLCNLRGDLEDSRIAAIGFSAESGSIVSTCNPKYWRWLRRRFSHSATTRIPASNLARVVELSPSGFSVEDVVRFVDQAPTLDRLLAAKEELDTKIQSTTELGKESLFLLIQETVAALASPVVTAFEIVKMLLRLDLTRWQRKP